MCRDLAVHLEHQAKLYPPQGALLQVKLLVALGSLFEEGMGKMVRVRLVM